MAKRKRGKEKIESVAFPCGEIEKNITFANDYYSHTLICNNQQYSKLRSN